MNVRELIIKLEELDEPFANIQFKNELHQIEDIWKIETFEDYYPERGTIVLLSDGD